MAMVAVVYHTRYGHTKLQAEAVLRGAAAMPGVTARIYTVEEATTRLEELDAADAIIFGSPTYMGNMSADMKAFLEATVKRWFSQAWKNKVAGAFTNSSSFSGDKLNTLLGMLITAMQHGMIFVGLGMLPAANKPDGMNSVAGPGPEAHNRPGSSVGPMAASFQVTPPSAPPQGDIETAEAYGRRVAEITLQLEKGRAQ